MNPFAPLGDRDFRLSFAGAGQNTLCARPITNVST
jgi:hypothetical protein